MKYIVFLFGLGAVLLFFFSSCSENTHQPEQNDQNIMEQTKEAPIATVDFTNHEFFQPVNESITHLHGLGYPNNQGSLFVATHHGIKVYSEGKWLETVDHYHDYMGFQATVDGFYSSGHPEEGSDLLDPLGLMKSEDFGETLEQISFYGESDFHHLSAGYFTPSIYIVNTVPNSQIDAGLFYSNDGGNSWEKSQLEGLPSTSAHSIANHPRLSKIVGISTPDGLYVSHNNGNSFSLVSDELPIGALYIKDESILYVMEEPEPLLLEQPLESDDANEIPLPELKKGETILYIAVNPLNENEISLSTSLSNVWMTKDYGESWTNILIEGNIP